MDAKQLEELEDKRKYIRSLISKLRNKDLTYQQVADELNTVGEKTIKGKKFTKENVTAFFMGDKYPSRSLKKTIVSKKISKRPYVKKIPFEIIQPTITNAKPSLMVITGDIDEIASLIGKLNERR